MDDKYKNLLVYTNNFSDENYIGSFKFGKIYHGMTYTGRVIVKIWDTSSSVFHDNELRFMREVIFLKDEKVHCQPGAVKLWGYVCDGQHLGVIYHLKATTIDCNLKAATTVCNQLNRDDFNWGRRIKVALWFARMVRFLHYKNPPYGPFVVHNIDAAHILLDEDYVPKLFDFSSMTGGGLFPDEPQDETEPSCGNAGERGDVFDFGLLLLSLISNKAFSKEEAMKSLIPQWSVIKFNSEGSPIDDKLVNLSLVHVSFEDEPCFYTCDGDEVSRLVMCCMHSSPDGRPSMKQVVRRLQKLQLVQKHSYLVELKPKPQR